LSQRGRRFAFWPIVRIVLLALFLLAFGWIGAVQGWRSLRGASTVLQYVAAVAQVAYGIGSVLLLAATLKASSLYRPLLLLWGCGLVITALLAPVVWGRSTWIVGAYSAIICVAIVLVVRWACRAHAHWVRHRKHDVIPIYF
jgi:hypothetical protein